METSLDGKRSGSNIAFPYMTDLHFLTRKSLFTSDTHSKMARSNVQLKDCLDLVNTTLKRSTASSLDMIDHVRLIHQTHVRSILEMPSLKDGSGKELRRLHDTVQQHLRALKALGHEPSSAFITSTLELKLDVATAFEWQKHSQSSIDVLPYQEFLDLRAQASEAATSEHAKKMHTSKNDFRPAAFRSKPIASHAAATDTSTGNCILCKSDKHPLYICMKFKA